MLWFFSFLLFGQCVEECWSNVLRKCGIEFRFERVLSMLIPLSCVVCMYEPLQVVTEGDLSIFIKHDHFIYKMMVTYINYKRLYDRFHDNLSFIHLSIPFFAIGKVVQDAKLKITMPCCKSRLYNWAVDQSHKKVVLTYSTTVYLQYKWFKAFTQCEHYTNMVIIWKKYKTES